MKKTKRFLTALLAFCVTVSLAGCGNNDQKAGLDGNKKEIVISYWNSGNGSKWIEETATAFEKKYPEYKVTIKASASIDAVVAAYGLEDTDETDLYFTNVQRLNKKYTLTIDELLDTKADGDAMTIGEKMNSGVLSNITSLDGHNYYLPWGGGVIGLVYNVKLFDKAGITQLPRTSDELTVACDTLYQNNITPLCHFTNGGYWHYLTDFYHAQYNGFDYYLNTFYACKDENGKSPSKDVFLKKDGRYEALKVLEDIVTPEYTLVGSNSKSHTEVQTEFVNDKAAMMINGSWLATELESAGGTEGIAMMKMPVLSSITDRLETIKTDYLLREVITAVDQVTDGEKKLSDFATGDTYTINETEISASDWDEVYEARNMLFENFTGMSAFVTNYSDNVEGAKKFLQFMCSDEGLKLYYSITNTPKPFKLSTGEVVDTSKMGGFCASQFYLMESASTCVGASELLACRHDIFSAGGANPYGTLGYTYVVSLSTNDSKNRKTAEQLWEEALKSIDKAYDNTWLPNIK